MDSDLSSLLLTSIVKQWSLPLKRNWGKDQLFFFRGRVLIVTGLFGGRMEGEKKQIQLYMYDIIKMNLGYIWFLRNYTKVQTDLEREWGQDGRAHGEVYIPSALVCTRMEIWQELEKGKIAWCDHPGVGFRASPTAAGQVLELKTEQVGCMQIQRGKKKTRV